MILMMIFLHINLYSLLKHMRAFFGEKGRGKYEFDEIEEREKV